MRTGVGGIVTERRAVAFENQCPSSRAFVPLFTSDMRHWQHIDSAAKFMACIWNGKCLLWNAALVLPIVCWSVLLSVYIPLALGVGQNEYND